MRVTPEAAALRSTLLAPVADTTEPEGHSIRWGRVGLGALLGAAVGAGLGLGIHAMEDVGESSPAELLGFAALGAIIGAFVGLTTGS